MVHSSYGCREITYKNSMNHVKGTLLINKNIDFHKKDNLSFHHFTRETGPVLTVC